MLDWQRSPFEKDHSAKNTAEKSPASIRALTIARVCSHNRRNLTMVLVNLVLRDWGGHENQCLSLIVCPKRRRTMFHWMTFELRAKSGWQILTPVCVYLAKDHAYTSKYCEPLFHKKETDQLWRVATQVGFLKVSSCFAFYCEINLCK